MTHHAADRTERRYRIGGLGEVLWDAFPEGEKFGGAPANFVCHCRSLGAEAFVISAVGADARGAAARSFLENHGVVVDGLAVTPGHETGVVLVTLDAAGKPTYTIKEGVAWDHIPWSEPVAGIAGSLDAVCFGSLCQRNAVSRATILRVLDSVPPSCLKVFDVNLRQSFFNDAVLRSSLEHADALKLNDEELPIVARSVGLGRGDEQDALTRLMEQFELKLAVLTCGSRGALMMTPDSVDFAESPPVPVVNTVGAGDAFTAATIMGFLAGKTIAAINEHANRVAAFVCTQHGAVPLLPDSLLEL